MEKVFITSAMTGCIIRVGVFNLMVLIMVLIIVIKDIKVVRSGHSVILNWRSRSSPQRSGRSAPSSLAVAVQARTKVRSIGLQVELKKVVVGLLKFCD